MKTKTQSFLLSFIVLVFLLLTGICTYFFLVYTPKSVNNWFGDVSPNLDRSQTIVLSAKLFLHRDLLLNESAARQRQEIFIIEPGQTGQGIANSLANRGFIPSAESFTDYLVYKGHDRLLQAGVYLIPTKITPTSLADSLVDQNPEDVAFAFPAGWRVEEIAQLLPSSGLAIKSEEFIDYVKSSASNNWIGHAGGNGLEGFLFPGKYQILRNTTLEELIEIFVQEFFRQIQDDYEQRLSEKGLSLYEGVILASIIEKEAVVAEEAPLIAGVFHNRLKAGMPLQSDPTVQYALGYDQASNNWWKNPLASVELRVTSPFNTYQNNGLPPSPICNPGMNSLLAVVNAEDTDFLFFRAACDGSGKHIFSRTYEEHLQAACQ